MKLISIKLEKYLNSLNLQNLLRLEKGIETPVGERCATIGRSTSAHCLPERFIMM